MQVNVMVILGNVVFELILIRATCKVLDMWSKTLFSASILAVMALSAFLRTAGMPEGLRVAVISPLSFFVLPIAFSRGPVQKRISRVCLLISASLPAEFAAAITYSLLSGQSLFPSPGTEVAPSEYALIYPISLLTSALTYEIVIAFCMRADDRDMAPLNLSVVALILGSYLFFGFFIIRVNNVQSQGSFISVASFLWTLLTFATTVSTLELAQRDARAMKDHANQVVITRQACHVKREVGTMAHASSSVRRLRHDLANQVGVIDELLTEDQYKAAERYLLELQSRASELMKDSYESPDDR